MNKKAAANAAKNSLRKFIQSSLCLGTRAFRPQLVRYARLWRAVFDLHARGVRTQGHDNI
jgi:hypothetical protein